MVSENSAETEIVVEGRTLFIAADALRGEELWRLDDKHVSLVKDIHPGTGESFIRDITCIGKQAYFSAYDGLHGSELWRSDGTAEGTVMVMDILPGKDSSLPRSFTAFDDRIYFSIVAEGGIELWVTDGTMEGTKEIFPATRSGSHGKETAQREPDVRRYQYVGEGGISRSCAFPGSFTNNVFHVRVDSLFPEKVRIRTRKNFETIRVANAN